MPSFLASNNKGQQACSRDKLGAWRCVCRIQVVSIEDSWGRETKRFEHVLTDQMKFVDVFYVLDETLVTLCSAEFVEYCAQYRFKGHNAPQ